MANKTNNTVTINGISFSTEQLDALKNWLVPATPVDRALIAIDADTLGRVSDFLLRHWDVFNPDDDGRVKSLLQSLSYIREKMQIFACAHTS